MEEQTIITTWDTLKEYIPVKDHQHAADHLINSLLDCGCVIEDLNCLARCDQIMEDALAEYADEDDPDSDEDDYNYNDD